MPFKAIALVPFKYDRSDYQIHRGQIFETKGYVNDSKLLGLGYIIRFDKALHKEVQCDGCGRKFMDQDFYYEHKRLRDCMSKKQEMTDKDLSRIVGRDMRSKKYDAVEPPPA